MNLPLENFANFAHPQLLSLIVTVLIVFIMALTAFIKVKKVRPNQAPTGVAYVAEAYVGMFDNQFTEVVGETKLQHARVYILTLGTFLLVGNGVAVLGLEPIVTSYSVPFTLAFASWLGIFTSGMIYRKFKYLKDFINPIDLFTKISPLISLSFRIYGNVIGGTAVIFLFYSFIGNAGTPLPGAKGVSAFVFLAPVITPIFHFYFDIFGSTLQAYIFTLLTTIYWLVESDNDDNQPTKSKKKNFKTKKQLPVVPATIY